MPFSLNTAFPGIALQIQKRLNEEIKTNHAKIPENIDEQLEPFIFIFHKQADFEFLPIHCARKCGAKITMQNPDQIQLGTLNSTKEYSWVCFLGDCFIESNVVIKERVIIGQNVTIKSGAKIPKDSYIPDNSVVDSNGIRQKEQTF